MCTNAESAPCPVMSWGNQHLAIVRDGAHRLTDVAGGSERHCRDALTAWIARQGLPTGGGGLVVRVLQSVVGSVVHSEGGCMASYWGSTPAVSRTMDRPATPSGNELFQSLPLSERNAWAVQAIRATNRAGIWLRTWYCCECGTGVHSNNSDVEDLEAEIEKHERLHGIM